ncbi:MAG: cupin domain-containing protein [Thermoleophilia bacterium]
MRLTVAGITVTDPLGVSLEAIGPKPNTLAGAPVESAHEIYAEGRLEIGVWEVTPGSFTTVKNGVSELMHFIAGSGTIVGDDGMTTLIAPGVVLITPDGWSGTWHVSETVRKVYAIIATG